MWAAEPLNCLVDKDLSFLDVYRKTEACSCTFKPVYLHLNFLSRDIKNYKQKSYLCCSNNDNHATEAASILPAAIL